MAYLTSGSAAVLLGLRYNTFVRVIRNRNDLPGMVRVGVAAGFDPDKISELRERLIAEGVIREPAAAVAG